MEEHEHDRGFKEGQTDARLQGHDQHFAMINGSLIDINKQLTRMPWTIVGGMSAILGLAGAIAKAYSILFP